MTARIQAEMHACATDNPCIGREVPSTRGKLPLILEKR